MRVLYVTNYAPWNPKFGGAMRSNGIVRGLDRISELHIALAHGAQSEADAFLNNSPSYRHLHLLTSSGSECGSDFSLREAAGLLRGRAPFGESFRELVRTVDPDVVWYSGKESARGVGFAPERAQVLDVVDVQWRKIRRTADSLRGMPRLKALARTAGCRAEDRWMASKVDVVVMANAGEAGLLGRSERCIPLANGFDFGSEPRVRERTGRGMVFFGSMFYYPNLDAVEWFCRDILPSIRAQVPDACLDVVGHHEGHLDSLSGDPAVRVLGFVDDLAALIDQSAFLIVPLRIAGGTRLKILEAWSNGLPVVSTTIGAEGLEAEHGRTALIGDTPERFAAECVRLLNSPEIGVELARAGFAHGKRVFDWEAIYPKLDEVLQAAVGHRRR